MSENQTCKKLQVCATPTRTVYVEASIIVNCTTDVWIQMDYHTILSDIFLIITNSKGRDRSTTVTTAHVFAAVQSNEHHLCLGPAYGAQLLCVAGQVSNWMMNGPVCAYIIGCWLFGLSLARCLPGSHPSVNHQPAAARPTSDSDANARRCSPIGWTCTGPS